jgi:Holliday junction resolvase
MDISERRHIPELNNFIKVLHYGDTRDTIDTHIQLLGSSALKSQQNYSDYDLFCNVKEKNFDTVLEILNKTEDGVNMYLIEIKFQNDKRKVKCEDMEEFIKQRKVFESMKMDMIKLDYVIYINYKLVELSIIYNLKHTNDENHEIVKRLKQDIKDYHTVVVVRSRSTIQQLYSTRRMMY